MDYKERIKELEDQSKKIQEEIDDLKDKHSGYFIGRIAYGDGDYWDEYFTDFGRMTELEAKEKFDEYMEDPHTSDFDSGYFEVDYETYVKYLRWYYINRAVLFATLAFGEKDDHVKYLEEKESEIIKELGIKYPSFQHISQFR